MGEHFQFFQPQTYTVTHQLTPSQVEAQRLAQVEQRRQEMERAMEEDLNQTVAKMGFLPPSPPPLILLRGLRVLSASRDGDEDPDQVQVWKSFSDRVKSETFPSLKFVHSLQLCLDPSRKLRIRRWLMRVDRKVNQALVSFMMPPVADGLKEKMAGFEKFLSEDWRPEEGRGIIAVHVDIEHESTILQIGLASHGPVYITLPGLLNPEQLAERSIAELLRSMTPFRDTVDPLAVIDGSHQGLNYNPLLSGARIFRAASDDTKRLAENLHLLQTRERLAPANTAIFNSAPATEQEYQRIFPEGRSWRAWRGEAQLWNDIATSAQFVSSAQVSRESLLSGLSQAKNVIVIVAHCDGSSMYLAEPEPAGTVVTAEHLLEHGDQIRANRPFVYLFSCKAGSLSNIKNFASTLLDCGAAGVVASQAEVGSTEGRSMLQQVLNEERAAPPLEDYYRAMRKEKFYDMEVFLA